MIPQCGDTWYIKNPKVSGYEVKGKTIQRSNKGYALISHCIQGYVHYQYTSDDGYFIKSVLVSPIERFLEMYTKDNPKYSLLQDKIDKIKSSI